MDELNVANRESTSQVDSENDCTNNLEQPVDSPVLRDDNSDPLTDSDVNVPQSSPASISKTDFVKSEVDEIDTLAEKISDPNLAQDTDYADRLETVTDNNMKLEEQLNENPLLENSQYEEEEENGLPDEVDECDSYESESETDSSSSEESTEGEEELDNRPNQMMQERLKELDRYAAPVHVSETPLSGTTYNPRGDFRPYMSEIHLQQQQVHHNQSSCLDIQNSNGLERLCDPEHMLCDPEAQLPGLDAVLNQYHSSSERQEQYMHHVDASGFYPQQPLHVYTTGNPTSNSSSSFSSRKYPNIDYLVPATDAACLDFPCPECGKCYTNRASLKNHLKKHYPTEEKRYKCSICSYSSQYHKNLMKHNETIHNQPSQDTSLFCDVCGKAFMTDTECREHRKLHTVDNTYACTQCPKQFKTKLKLKYHMDVHNPNKQYKCDMPGCDRAFSTPKYLNNHRNEFHKLQPKRLECPVDDCKEVFQRKSHLNRHMATHGEKHFICPFQDCSRRFRSQETLRVHQFRHTGQEPYQCDLCDLAFKQRAELSNHYREQHAKDAPNPHSLHNCYRGNLGSSCSESGSYDARLLQRSTSLPVNSGSNSPQKTPLGTGARAGGDVYAFTEFDSHGSLTNSHRGRVHMPSDEDGSQLESRIDGIINNLDKDVTLHGMLARPLSRSSLNDLLSIRINSLVDDFLKKNKFYNFFATQRLSDEQINVAESILLTTTLNVNTRKRRTSVDLIENSGNTSALPSKVSRKESSTDFKIDDFPPLSVSQFDEVFGEVTSEMLNAALSDGNELEAPNSSSPAVQTPAERQCRQNSAEDESKSTDSRTPLARLNSLVEDSASLGLDLDGEDNSCVGGNIPDMMSRVSQYMNDGSYREMDEVDQLSTNRANDNGDLLDLDDVLKDLKDMEERNQQEERQQQENQCTPGGIAQTTSSTCQPQTFQSQEGASSQLANSQHFANSSSSGPTGFNATPVNTTPESQWSDSDYSVGRDSVGLCSNATGPSTSTVASSNTSLSAVPPSTQQPVSESPFTSPGPYCASAQYNTFYPSPVKSRHGLSPNGGGYDTPGNFVRQSSFPEASPPTNVYRQQPLSDHHLRSLASMGSNPYVSAQIGSFSDRSQVGNQCSTPQWQSGPNSHTSATYPPTENRPPINQARQTQPSGPAPQHCISEYAPGSNSTGAPFTNNTMDFHNRSMMQATHAPFGQPLRSDSYPPGMTEYHGPQGGQVSQMGPGGVPYDKYPAGMYTGGARDSGYPGQRGQQRSVDPSVGPFQQGKIPAGYRYMMTGPDGKPTPAAGQAMYRSANPYLMERYAPTGPPGITYGPGPSPAPPGVHYPAVQGGGLPPSAAGFSDPYRVVGIPAQAGPPPQFNSCYSFQNRF